MVSVIFQGPVCVPVVSGQQIADSRYMKDCFFSQIVYTECIRIISSGCLDYKKRRNLL